MARARRSRDRRSRGSGTRAGKGTWAILVVAAGLVLAVLLLRSRHHTRPPRVARSDFGRSPTISDPNSARPESKAHNARLPLTYVEGLANAHTRSLERRRASKPAALVGSVIAVAVLALAVSPGAFSDAASSGTVFATGEAGTFALAQTGTPPHEISTRAIAPEQDLRQEGPATGPALAMSTAVEPMTAPTHSRSKVDPGREGPPPWMVTDHTRRFYGFMPVARDGGARPGTVAAGSPDRVRSGQPRGEAVTGS